MHNGSCGLGKWIRNPEFCKPPSDVMMTASGTKAACGISCFQQIVKDESSCVDAYHTVWVALSLCSVVGLPCVPVLVWLVCGDERMLSIC